MPNPVRRTRLLASAILVALATLTLGLPVSTEQPAPGRRTTRIAGRDAVEGEVLVKMRGRRDAMRDAVLEAQADADQVERFSTRGMRRIRSRQLRTQELINLIRLDPDVEYVEPNYIVYALALPNDPAFGNLWGLLNTGSNPVGGGGTPGVDISATDAWDVTIGSRANVVGVIDTGVDYNHPDLAANMWSAPSGFQVTVGGQNIICQAGTHGFNAITRTCDPMDNQFHGTHVAGTIGAVGNNGIGVVGVNWQTSMMGLKFLGANGSGTTSDAIAAIEFAIQTKAKFAASNSANIRVLSNSWGGGGYSTALTDAIAAAEASDMLFVAAAGNSHSDNDLTPAYPASYTNANIVAVASSTSADLRSSFSNYGATSVDLAAPGSAIYSTMPGNSYATLQGTSMATPQVSGAAMLALSMCNATTAELKSMLLDSVDPVAAFAGLTVTGGRLNVASMMATCERLRVTGLTLTPDLAAPRAPGTTITFTAAATGGQAPLEYEWVMFNGSTWSTLSAWSTTKTFSWTPTIANASYQIAVRARSAWNTGQRELSTALAFPIMPLVTGLTMSPNLVAPQAVGTTITWTANASGGQPPIHYQWALFNGSTWTDATGWSSSNTFSWTPASSNSAYQVAVRARGSWNSGVREMVTMQAFAIKPVVTAIGLTSDLAAPRAPGTTVTFTASASGGEAPYHYQWAVFNGTTWTTATSWSTSNTFAWTPTQSNAQYQIAARARGSWNSGPRELAVTQAFTIMPLVTGLTLTPSAASPQGLGASVTWTAAASGGTAPYQYQFALYNGSTWSDLTSWSATNAYTWTPAAAGSSYQIAVRARGSWNTGAREMVTIHAYTILPKVTSLTMAPNVAAPRAPNTTITWTATASGGQAPYTYEWAIFNGVTWTTVSTWQSTNTFAWTPTQANAGYQVAVRVRSAWNTGNRDMAATQAFAIIP